MVLEIIWTQKVNMNELGQLFITGINGHYLTDEEARFISDEKIGGVILFDRNFESLGQVGELINSIQELNKQTPLFIALDYEGGRVQRFKKSLSLIPPMLDIGTLGSPKLCYELGEIMAEEIKSIGINLNLAPCCDIFSQKNNKVIGDRAFGKDHETVSKFVTSMVRAFQNNGIIACAKHFPGHGPTSKDSHFELPVVKKKLDQIHQEDIQPFIKVIKSRVEMIMMAHLLVDDIDDKLPTSLSPKAHQILRDELGFKGVIISDDMDMKAITDNYGLFEATKMALDSGTDIVEFSKFESAKESYERLKESNFNSSHYQKKVDRILKLKKEYLSDHKPIFVPEIGKKIKTEQTESFLSELNKKLLS